MWEAKGEYNGNDGFVYGRSPLCRPHPPLQRSRPGPKLAVARPQRRRSFCPLGNNHPINKALSGLQRVGYSPRNSQFRSGIRANKIISLQFTLNCHAERSLRSEASRSTRRRRCFGGPQHDTFLVKLRIAATHQPDTTHLPCQTRARCGVVEFAGYPLCCPLVIIKRVAIKTPRV